MTITIAIIATLAMAALATYAWLRYRRSAVPWKPLPGIFTGAMYRAPDGVTGEWVAEVLGVVAEVLGRHTKWGLNAAMTLRKIKIYVSDTESWTDMYGRKIGGFQQGYTAFVSRSLSSLCHECAHFCEYWIDHEIDGEHATWMADGIWEADEEYRRWLDTRSKQ